jgi:hypothetical protein
VDNLVVLQVMEQGDGNDIRAAGEIDCGARYARLLMEFPDEIRITGSRKATGATP